MDTVVLDGVSYVKASVAAKKFGYTQDYIGQLCRGKKIDARLVGRTWFVNIDSIVDHRSGKYKNLRKNEDVSETLTVAVEETTESTAKFVAVAPVITNKVTKSLKPTIHRTAEGQRKLTIQYSSDEESLLPTITKRVEHAPRSVRVVPANAKTVRIRSNRSKTAFVPDELPEVSLKGNLKIEDYPDAEPETEEEQETVSEESPINKAISEERENTPIEVSVTETVGSRSKKIELKKLDISIQKAAKDAELAVAQSLPEPSFVAEPFLQQVTPVESEVSQPKVVSFQPQSVRTRDHEVRVSLLASMSPLLATVLALGCVLLLFSASAQVLVSDFNSSSTVIFQKANLLDVLLP